MRLPQRRLRSAATRLTLTCAALTMISTGIVAPSPGRDEVSSRALQLTPPGQAAARAAIKTVDPPISTHLVGLQWEGRREGAVEVRVRKDGRWGAWTELHGNPDEGPDTGNPEHHDFTSAGPAWTGEGVEKIQVRAVEGNLRGLKLHMIKSKSQSSSLAAASASPATPGIISRAQWGANEAIRNTAPDCESNPEYASTVRYAVVHHTVSINTYTIDEADDLIRGIYQFHVEANRWCDIGYNFIVDRFGRTFEGRYGGIDRAVIGAHAGGFNSGSTGVSLLGQYQSSVADPAPGQPSAAMLEGLRHLLAWKLAYHSVDPRDTIAVTSSGSSRYPPGTVVQLPTVSVHRDVSDTACPGDNVVGLLPQLRIDVQGIILATPPHPLPGWSPRTGMIKLITLNAFGGLQAAGGQSAVPHSAYWPGFAIARAVLAQPDGGWVLDGWGGLHPYGSAPKVSGSAWFPGRDITRAIGAGPLPRSGYVLDAYGGVHPFGGAPAIRGNGYWPGWDIARGLAMRTDGLGGYVLDGWGGLHPVGAAAKVWGATGYWAGWDIARAVALRPDGTSGYVLDGWGGLHPFGGAPKLAGSRYTPGRDEMRGLALTADGTSGWVVDIHGAIWPVGKAGPVPASGTWRFSGLGRGIALGY